MKTILLIDDNSYVLQGLLISLRNCVKDCKILTAENGKEALEILKSVPVDFILTDLLMPVMDGYKLLKYVKMNCPHALAFAMTNTLTPKDMEKLQSLDVAQCIEKPFNFEVLAHKISDELKALSGESHH